LRLKAAERLAAYAVMRSASLLSRMPVAPGAPGATMPASLAASPAMRARMKDATKTCASLSAGRLGSGVAGFGSLAVG
jgi:hypothetical protein